MRVLVCFAAASWLGAATVGCGDDGGTAPADGGALDAAPDGGLDASTDAGPACGPSAGGDPAAGRWALSMFHYNIQYVAGGLDGIFAPPLGDQFRYDEEETEDLIIRESFLPMLGLLEAHPSWQLTFEMQGLMLEKLAERFPGDLVRLRALVDARQVELVSFHYSDQMLLAYPRDHARRSLAMNRAAAAAAGIELSSAVWTQEGFFGRGIADLLTAEGWEIGVVARNLVSYQYDPLPDAAFYELDGVPIVLAGRSTSVDTGAEMRWSYFGDAELLATGEASPYLGDYFRHQPEAVQAYEDELSCLEAEGFRIGRIDDYVGALRAAGIPPEALPPILDGDWQPSSTDSLHLWMGGYGMLFDGDRDNDVLTGNVRAGWILRAAETLVASAAASALPDAAARLAAGFRELMLAEVSDSTGWSPWQGEVEYSLGHAAAARGSASAIIEEQLAALGWDAARVDPAAGTAQERSGAPPVEALAPATAPIDVTMDGSGRTMATTWRRRPDGVYVLDVDIGPAPATVSDVWEAAATVSFAWDDGVIRYTPAELDRIEEHTATDFAFDHIWLPAANGLGGVRGGFVIQDLGSVHLAFGFFSAEGVVRVRDETIPKDASAHWRFFFTPDPDQALSLARSANMEHPLWVCASDASCGL